MQRIEAKDSEDEENMNLGIQPEFSTQTLETDFGDSPAPFFDDNTTLVELPPKSEEEFSSSESESQLNEAAPKIRSNQAVRTTESDSSEPQQPDHTEQREKFEIESRLHENYIWFVQKGTSNEEWNAFCTAETGQLKCQKERWKLFNEDTDEGEEDRGCETLL